MSQRDPKIGLIIQVNILTSDPVTDQVKFDIYITQV